MTEPLTERLIARDALPDWILRLGIRRLLNSRLRELRAGGVERQLERMTRLIEQMDRSPIAVATRAANVQHYEVPSEFFRQVLGRRMKYSCGYWPAGTADLDSSEERMLELTCERAGIRDGERILELGCGWGSLTLYMAQHFPEARIVGVSNSRSQKAHILGVAKEEGLKNIQVLTQDMKAFRPSGRFDRVVSVEMFEHMRNYRALLDVIGRALRPHGYLFIHIFTHREHPYFFEIRDSSDWMSKYFFTGGVMPSDDLLYCFQDRFTIARHWRLSGNHYKRTAEAWLQRMGANRDTIMPILERVYGSENATRWWAYWRLFFLSCSELWGYNGGDEWIVSHYLMQKRN